MVDRVLTFLQEQLDGFLRTTFGVSEPAAVLASLVKPDGSPLGIDNRVALSLVNLEKETALGLAPLPEPSPSGIERVAPPLHVNLSVLLSAHFSSYPDALRFLSAAIAFLNAKPVFTPRDSSAFPAVVQRITVEMINLSVQDLNYLWSISGARYVPSACYKVRMVPAGDARVTGTERVIAGTAPEIKP